MLNIQNKCHELSTDEQIIHQPMCSTLVVQWNSCPKFTIGAWYMEDVRNVNIVFENTGYSHIIDFDLAKNENDVYPSVYVKDTMVPGQEKVLKIHDKHSSVIISLAYGHSNLRIKYLDGTVKHKSSS